jgi:fumarylacetoacetase
MTARSWIAGHDGGFGLDNLPYGSVLVAGRKRAVVRVGSDVVVLGELVEAGLLSIDGVDPEVFRAPDITGFLRCGRDAWQVTRSRLVELLRFGNTEVQAVPGLTERAVLPLASVAPVLPFKVGDFVDMYSSIEHATNLGRILRPGPEPIPPNWRHMPIGYHGRSGSVVPSGTIVPRPVGQRRPVGNGAGPTFGPERMLDFELELGFVVGDGPGAGVPVRADDASRYVFGFVLLNDWSAREIQRWEYQPLGPNLGKSFASTISPWVVPLDALDPVRVSNVTQEPEPLPHLRVSEPWAFDIDLEVELRPAGGKGRVVSRGNSRSIYWNAAQQLAHATSNGAPISAGDLFGTGTISGWEPGTQGSLIELTNAGQNPIDIGGTCRGFLEDGDTVTLRGAARRNGVHVSFGEASGTIVAPRRDV